MTTSAQANPAATARAADAGSGAGVTDSAEVQALLVEIFARTGQKVQIDDPLVAAALIHSALLRRAGDDAAQAINEAAHSARAPQPLDHDVKRTIGWRGPWQAKAMLVMVLFLLCMGAGALGAYMVIMRLTLNALQ